jgi:hypothetical protein
MLSTSPSQRRNDVSAMPMPDDLLRLKAEYFERINGRGDGCGRGREYFGYVFP